MSKNENELYGGCASILFILLFVGIIGYFGYNKIRKIEFVQELVKSDEEQIIGKWKIVGGAIYSDGETEKIKIQKSGNNGIFGTLENPKYFIFSEENEFIRTQTNGWKTYTYFEIRNDKIITEYQKMEIINLTEKSLIFKEELFIEPIPGQEQYLGKIYYTFETKKVH